MYWATGLLGLAIVIAPFIFGYAENATAMWTSLVLGGGVTLASFLEGIDDSKGTWEYWATGIAGVIAIIAPFVLGFGSIGTAMWTSVGIGLVLSIIAATKLYSTRVDVT